MNHFDTLKLALEFDKRFTSLNGIDVPERVSVPRDEWRALLIALQEALAEQPAQQQQGPGNLKHLAEICPELNMSNYTIDDVDELNNWAIEVATAIDAMAEQPAPVQQEPVSGVVIRDGLPTLLRECDIKPTDARLYTSPQPAQHEPVAWEGKTKVGLPTGAHRLIFSDRVRADEWMSGFVDGHAWLEPLTYTSPPAQRTRVHATTWRGLTHAEIDVAWNNCEAPYGFAEAIEAKLKAKNSL